MTFNEKLAEMQKSMNELMRETEALNQGIDKLVIEQSKWISWENGPLPGIKTEILDGDFSKIVNSKPSSQWSKESFVLNTTSPFNSNQKLAILFNSNIKTKSMEVGLTSNSDKTGGGRYTAGYFTKNTYRVSNNDAHLIVMNRDPAFLQDLYSDIKVNLINNDLHHRIPEEIASSKSDINMAIDTLHEYDFLRSLVHEATHGSEFNFDEAVPLSKSLNSEEIASKTLATQLKESQADVAASIYVLNQIPQSDIGKKKLFLLIMHH